MIIIDTIRNIYLHPNLNGDRLIEPVKSWYGHVVADIRNSSGCKRVAMIITNAVYSILISPVLCLCATVGMTIKSYDYFIGSKFKQAKDTMQVWSRLAQAIQQPFDYEIGNNFRALKKAKEFPAWLNQHSAKLSEILALDFSSCDLDHLPEFFGQLKNLQELDLENNNLKSLPSSIGQLTKLQKLKLSCNDLRSLPASIGQLTNLQELYLFWNSLESLPQTMIRLTNLRILVAVGNGFTDSPSFIQQLQNLVFINDLDQVILERERIIFELNRLNEIGLELQFDMPQLSQELSQLRSAFSEERLSQLEAIMIQRDELSKSLTDEMKQLNQRSKTFVSITSEINRIVTVHRHRSVLSLNSNKRQQSQSLDMILSYWLSEYQKLFPKLCTDNQRYPTHSQWKTHYQALLNHADKDRLRIFLDRLTTTHDFKSGPSKKNLIYRTAQMLECAAVNLDFREGMFANIAEALGTCGDRITLFFNQIEILWYFCNANQLNDQELIKLIIGVKRINMLRNIAARRVIELGLGDAVEVHLYYQVKLKEALELPISVHAMLYEGVAGINVELLQEDKAKVLQETSTLQQKADILVAENKWVEKIKKAHQDQFDQITETLSAQIDFKPKQEQQTIAQAELLKLLFQQQTDALLKNLTLKYLTESIEVAQAH